MRFNNSPSTRFYSAVLITAAFALVSGTVIADDASPVTRARALLYTARENAIVILEEAVRRSPDNIQYWVEYIHALDIDSLGDFADLASRHALRLHPNNPDLMAARTRLLRNGAALDVLANLAKIKGHEDQAHRLSDLITLCLSIPEDGRWSPDLYAYIIDRFLVVGQAGRSRDYLDEALARFPAEQAKPLLARKAILLALSGQFDDALKAHRAAGNLQVHIEGAYWGLADVLFVKNKPQLAIASFAQQEPADDNMRRILACARARTHDVDTALKLLAADTFEDRLIRLRILIDAGRDDDAKSLGERIVGPMHITQGSYGGPWLMRYRGPVCLFDEYRRATRWLLEQFPEKRQGIEYVLGTGNERFGIKPLGWSPTVPLSQTIPQLEATLKDADAKDIVQIRRHLAVAYAEGGRYSDAAQVLIPLVAVKDWKGRISLDAADWAILNHRAEALVASEKDYWQMASARTLIANIGARRWNSRKIDNKPWLTDDQVVEGLVKIGTAVLADTLTQLGPNVISGQDRRPWVAVIHQLGSERDAPVLIRTLYLVTMGDRHPSPQQDENDRLTAAAIEDCLEKLTLAKPPGGKLAEASLWWSAWWSENAARITKE